ncbi:MAG: formate dehydrogenase subunit gamma, partial [Methyloligellaceae bacterium]
TRVFLIALVVILSGAATILEVRAETSSVKPSKSGQFTGDLPGNVKGSPRDPEIWRYLRKGGRGHANVPDPNAVTLIQSSGQRWRIFRKVHLPRYGAWTLSGACVFLTIFFMVRGRIRIDTWFSGRSILRFGLIERAAHWLLAVSFMILALTGLNMVYGSTVIKPLVGHAAFSKLAAYGKWFHDFTGFAFIAGLFLVLLLWVRDNIPKRCDLTWVARGGGHLPARRFNAGQKIFFWVVILAGMSVSFSGLCLLFPFIFTPFSETFAVLNVLGFELPTELSPVEEMQLTLAWHGVLGILMTVVVIAHIYIGSLGMEGAFDAMATGFVDENWARQHHSLWAAELGAGESTLNEKRLGNKNEQPPVS